jgi:hypothetical protein
VSIYLRCHESVHDSKIRRVADKAAPCTPHKRGLHERVCFDSDAVAIGVGGVEKDGAAVTSILSLASALREVSAPVLQGTHSR